jgi:hypothetical protein
MRNRTDRLNRGMLGFIGTLVLLLGIGGVLIGAGVFGDKRANSSLVYPRAAWLLHREQSWLWWVLGAAALVIALIALYCLAVQLRIERIGVVALQRSSDGDSTLAAGALCDAIRTEAEAMPEIDRARARLTGDEHDPQLVLSVWLCDGVDLESVRESLDDTVLRHARESLGRDSLRAWLRIEVDAGAGERVQ